MYTATLRDSAVLSEFDLTHLLGLLAEIQAPSEDACIWQGPRVVCVRHGDGRLTVPNVPQPLVA
jgi:hypothetical protein